MARELRIEQLLGREVLGANHQRIGHIEEFRAERRGAGCVAAEVIVGMRGLLERLDLHARMLLGRKRNGYVVRWDQLDLSDPRKPRLRCPVNELARL
jgi:hypothetical protein